jgi:hypothetical protein
MRSGGIAQTAGVPSCSLPVSAARLTSPGPGSTGASRGSSRAAVLAQPQQNAAAAASAAAGLTVWSLARDSGGCSGGPGLRGEASEGAWEQAGLDGEGSAGQLQQQWLQPAEASAGSRSVHRVPSSSRQQVGAGSEVVRLAGCQALQQQQQQQQQQLSACSSSSSLPSIPSCADVVQIMLQGQRHKRQQQCQLAALRASATGSGTPWQQQQQQQREAASALPMMQQGQPPQAATADTAAAGSAVAAALEAVWKGPQVAARPAGDPAAADAASLGAPPLQSLVQQAAKVRERRSDSAAAGAVSSGQAHYAEGLFAGVHAAVHMQPFAAAQNCVSLEHSD